MDSRKNNDNAKKNEIYIEHESVKHVLNIHSLSLKYLLIILSSVKISKLFLFIHATLKMLL